MATFEIKVFINRSVEDVFNFISNAENMTRWRSSTLAVKRTSDEPIRVGSVFQCRFAFIGRPFDANVVVTMHEPYRRYGTRMVEGPFPLEASYTLTSENNGTDLALVVDGSPGGFFKLAEPLVVSLARRSYESDMQNLKEMFDARAI
jgi:uncharacterized protein YndB with AHSA1/START domain